MRHGVDIAIRISQVAPWHKHEECELCTAPATADAPHTHFLARDALCREARKQLASAVTALPPGVKTLGQVCISALEGMLRALVMGSSNGPHRHFLCM